MVNRENGLYDIYNNSSCEEFIWSILQRGKLHFLDRLPSHFCTSDYGPHWYYGSQCSGDSITFVQNTYNKRMWYFLAAQVIHCFAVAVSISTRKFYVSSIKDMADCLWIPAVRFITMTHWSQFSQTFGICFKPTTSSTQHRSKVRKQKCITTDQ